MRSINPYNQKTIAEYAEDSEETVSGKLSTAHQAWESFRWISFGERAVIMKDLGKVLERRKEECALMMTLEMGKPIAEARAEIEKCTWVCNYYAENAETQLQANPVVTDADNSFISYEPLGVILAVMPWNFPFWQVFRFAAPTIMAGNTAVLKHSSNVQACAAKIEDLFLEAGFKAGVFQNLRISSAKVEGVLQSPVIKGVSLTGSGKAGSAVAAIAGREIKPSLLELGGSCGFIVLKDADLKVAASLGVKARMINTAQSCIAAKRFIVEKEIHDRFVTLFTEEMRQLRSGDPREDSTQVGPMARVDLTEELEQQLQKSINKGAQLVLGGHRSGAYFEPTIITGVTPGMPAFDEELFGPVAAIIKAEDAEDAVRLNNLSKYGLGASIITTDLERALELASKIEDGAVFINELVKSDPRMAFGGTKKSGYGRELGALGIKEFVNAKTVHVKF